MASKQRFGMRVRDATSPPQRLMIFEPVSGGHHLQYVHMLIEALREHADELIVILASDAKDSDEYRVHLRHLESSPKLRMLTADRMQLGRKSLEGHALEALLALRRAMLTHRPDRVFIPYADGMVQVLGALAMFGRGLLPDVPIEALVMRGGFAYPAARATHQLRHELLYRLLANTTIERLHVLDPLVFADITRRSEALARKASVIPEPVEPLPKYSKEEARLRLGIPAVGQYVVCAGALDTRKGIDLLLSAAMHGGLPSDARLLLVGRMSDSIRTLHARAQERLGHQLVTIDGYVTEEQFALAVIAADIVAVPYPNHQGSSGLLVRALAAGRYLLSSQYGWIGWATQTFGGGIAADVAHQASLSRALRTAIAAAPSHRLPAIARRFVTYHTAENHRAHWTRILRRGRQDENVPMTWEEVIFGRSASGQAALAGQVR